MLGIGKDKSPWQWVAYGKHPCAKDYMSVGTETALSQAFVGWIEKGYGALDPSTKTQDLACSWRFWAKTPKEDLVVVGLVRDSCDAIGRPYPLMVLGSGAIAGWQNKWHLLPYACEGTWTRMEQLAARRHENAARFEEELFTLSPPQTEWEKYDKHIKGILAREQSGNALEKNKAKLASLSRNRELFVDIDITNFESLFSVIGLWHALIKARNTEVPSAVFMGGGAKGTFFAAFFRPLSPKDFTALWSAVDRKEAQKWS